MQSIFQGLLTAIPLKLRIKLKKVRRCTGLLLHLGSGLDLIQIANKWIRAPLRRYSNEEDGVAAVEFALVSFPFLFLIIGIIEMSLMFTAQSVLEYSNSAAGRLIRTGQLQDLTIEEQIDMFEETVCDNASFLMDCDQIQYQVQTVPDYASAQTIPAPEYDEDGLLVDSGFDIGGSSAIVFVRVVYRYPITLPIMQQLLSNYEDEFRMMISTSVLQTEPYDFEDAL